jgi:succinate dehydrogenase / fumarate reductase cytochrome b subunit
MDRRSNSVLNARRIGLLEALRYQGRENMLTWVLHRITGLGILLFVTTHIVAAFFLHALGDTVSTVVTRWYQSRPVQVFVYFCVLYHAFNGLRVLLEDFYPPLLRYHRELIWLQWAVFVPTFGLPSYFMLQAIILGGG